MHGIVSLGFNAIKLKDIPLADLIRFVQQERPIIVFLSVSHLPYGGDAGMHAVVINGSESKFISYIDPARGQEIELAIDTFMAAWDERGRLGLLIEKP